jgi:hypothetical protein
VFDNHGRVRIVSVRFFPVSGRRDRACRVSKTVGEAWGVGWVAVELWEEKVGEYLGGDSGSEEERAGGLELVAEDRERESSIQVVEDMRREGVGGQSFGESDAAGVVDIKAVGEGNAEAVTGGKGSLHGKSGSRMRAAELKSSEAGLRTVATG